MPRNILMLFPDEWDLALLKGESLRGYQFHCEGFDLFSFPDNAHLFTYQAQRFADRIARKYANAGIDGIFTSDEQFGPVAAALIGERLGLPCTSLDGVLLTQHKYWSRIRQRECVPEATPQFGTVDRTTLAQGQSPLAFPLYVKPIKAAFSVLAKRVNSWADVGSHVTFGWWEDAIIRRLVKPFNDATRSLQQQRFGEYIDAYTMICETALTGHQVTLNGYAQKGKVTMLGTVDSIMYPGTDQFMRFQYPSRLPAAVLTRMNELALKVVPALEFDHGMFNVEMIWNPNTDDIHIVELNPRVAGQFFDLFRAVDGYCLFEASLALACGEMPVIRQREGKRRHAASFVLRDFTHQGLAYVPSKREIEALRRAHPESHLQIYIKTGNGLRRELKWLGSYRYAVMNIAGATLEDMFAQFVRTRDAIGFHPASYRERYARDSIQDLLQSHSSLALR